MLPFVAKIFCQQNLFEQNIIARQLKEIKILLAKKVTMYQGLLQTFLFPHFTIALNHVDCIKGFVLQVHFSRESWLYIGAISIKKSLHLKLHVPPFPLGCIVLLSEYDYIVWSLVDYKLLIIFFVIQTFHYSNPKECINLP